MSRLQEFQELYNEMKLAWKRQEKTVLVILANVKGSAYRLPGTKMLMTSGGNMYGTISGGCLEADLFEWAKKVFETNQPMLHQYDLSETAIWSLGIGCKGELEILFLPVEPKNPICLKLEQQLQQHQAFLLLIDLMACTTYIVDKNSDVHPKNANLPLKVIERTKAVFNQQTRAEIFPHHAKRYYIDVVKPSEQLIIAGAGQDARPVVELAEKAGFAVTVLDSRSHLNNERNFPNASHITTEIENLNNVQFQNCWWIIMNHHQEKDEASLRYAIESNPRFIGVLGPRYRTNKILANIGYNVDSGPIHSPVGLDIGSETSDEVAISIVSELMSLRADRQPNFLHGKGKIHV